MKVLICSVVLFCAFPALTPRAQAMDPDVRTVLMSGAYGIVGGTLLGAVSYPLHQSVRGIFICSSIGLYMGLAGGIYLIHNWDQFESELSQTRKLESLPQPSWVRAHEDSRAWGSLAHASDGGEKQSGILGPSYTFQF